MMYTHAFFSISMLQVLKIFYCFTFKSCIELTVFFKLAFDCLIIFRRFALNFVIHTSVIHLICISPQVYLLFKSGSLLFRYCCCFLLMIFLNHRLAKKSETNIKIKKNTIHVSAHRTAKPIVTVL